MLRQVLAVAAAMVLGNATVAGETTQLENDAGHYRLHLPPNRSEVTIGVLRNWNPRIAVTDGDMIDGATVPVE